jgi:hypothetical protein
VSFPRTFYHYGYLSPPSRRGFRRRSVGGLTVQAIAATLLLTRRSALGGMVCQKLNSTNVDE